MVNDPPRYRIKSTRTQLSIRDVCESMLLDHAYNKIIRYIANLSSARSRMGMIAHSPVAHTAARPWS